VHALTGCVATQPIDEFNRPAKADQESVRAKDIRSDRILDEVRATGGDIRRICDLFGLTVADASRYTVTLEHPDLTQTVP
jgi:hypothetical protein